MVATVGSFHLLHMMIDNYLLHTLEAHFEHQQESEYKRQMLSHYSESGTPYPILHVSSYTHEVQWCFCKIKVFIPEEYH